jgi:hypothetical protein
MESGLEEAIRRIEYRSQGERDIERWREPAPLEMGQRPSRNGQTELLPHVLADLLLGQAAQVPSGSYLATELGQVDDRLGQVSPTALHAA